MLAAAAARARVARYFTLSAVLPAVLAVFGCSQNDRYPIRLQFSLGSSLATGCHGLPESGQLRFYVSNLRMINANGEASTVLLDATPVQSVDAGTALVSWQGNCAASASAPADPHISGQAAAGDHEAVEFDLGVPFGRNHANPLAAPTPLNAPSMFWTWQSGYKFLRLDVGTDWSFHLGSTGCVSASAVRPPERCARPNVATIRLPAAAAREGAVVVDLDALLAGIDLAAASSCVDDYAEAEHCRALLSRLGINAYTGRCSGGCQGQALFRYDGGSP